jgi:hypothetical protein
MPPMLGTYGGAALLFGASTIVGQAVFVIAGRRGWSWLAPAVGLAVLVVLGAIAIGLPGHGATAAVICVLVLLACAVLVLARTEISWPWRGLAVVVLPVLGASIPFLANGRVGILGVSLDNDTSVHLLWTEGLRSSLMSSLYPIFDGYPLGPHSLVATLAAATGIRADHALDALLLVVVPITALAAAAAVPRIALWRKALIGLLASLTYLASAYYGQGSFKEPMMGLFLLAFVLVLRELRRMPGASVGETDPGGQGGSNRAVWARWARAGIPAGLLAAAAIYTYSYLALAWLGGFLVVWFLVELLASPAWILRATLRRHALTRIAAVTLGGGAVMVVAILPSLGRLLNYFNAVGASSGGGGIPTSNLGNLAGPLSPFEGLGVWLAPDYRFSPANVFHAGELASLALVVLIFGLLWALRRRDLALPAAVAICAAIYFYSQAHQSPYVTAKSLVVAAPLVMVVGARGLLSGRDASQGGGWWSTIRLLAGLAFAFVALHSSLLALRAEPVGSTAQTTELAQLRAVVGHAPTLFLGNDDFAGWELRGVHLAYPSTTSFPSPIAVALSIKPYVYGDAFDFDSVSPSQLNRFAYVITTNTPYASQPPANFQLARSLPGFQLWRRVGPTAPRLNIDTGQAPGAVLDCHTTPGARLSRRAGVAAIMETPVLSGAIAALSPGANTTVGMRLPRGEWDLSLQYTSAEILKLNAGGAHWQLPANTARPGPYFYFGSVRSDGRTPVSVQIYEEHPSRFASPLDQADLSSIAATSRPDARKLVPLADACGRYVDWYRLGS